MKRVQISTSLLIALLFGWLNLEAQENEEEVEEMGESIQTLEKTYYQNLLKLKRWDKEELEAMTETIEGVSDSIRLAKDTTDQKRDTENKDDDNSIEIGSNNINLNLNFGDSNSCSDSNGLSPVQFGFLNLDLGFNNYLNANDFQIPSNYEFLEVSTGKSVNVQLTFVKMGVSLIDHHLSLMTGIGIDYNNYRYENKQLLVPDVNQVIGRELQQGYDKYKLTTQYAFMPLEFRYDTKPEDHGSSFRFAAGGRAGYLIRSYTKLLENDGDKVKDFDDFNLRKYKFGLTGRIGYGHLNFYANYDITNLFEDGKGPELNPIAFGITLIGFHWD